MPRNEHIVTQFPKASDRTKVEFPWRTEPPVCLQMKPNPFLPVLSPQPRTIEHACVCAKSLQLCPTLCDSVDCSHQSPLSMGFCRQEYWNRLPCPPPGDLPNLGIEPMSLMSPALASGFFTTSTMWEAHLLTYWGTIYPKSQKKHSDLR